MVRVSDTWSRGNGFDSWPYYCHVATLGNSHALHIPLFNPILAKRQWSCAAEMETVWQYDNCITMAMHHRLINGVHTSVLKAYNTNSLAGKFIVNVNACLCYTFIVIILCVEATFTNKYYSKYLSYVTKMWQSPDRLPNNGNPSEWVRQWGGQNSSFFHLLWTKVHVRIVKGDKVVCKAIFRFCNFVG